MDLSQTASTDDSGTYPYCRNVGLDPEQLAKGMNNYPFTITSDKLVNGVVYELSTFKLKWDIVRLFLSQWMGPRFDSGWTRQKIRTVVEKLKLERTKLMRKKTVDTQQKVKDMLHEPFTIPLHTAPIHHCPPPLAAVQTYVDSSTQTHTDLHEIHFEEELRLVRDRLKTVERQKRNSVLREKRHNKLINKQKKIILAGIVDTRKYGKQQITAKKRQIQSQRQIRRLRAEVATLRRKSNPTSAKKYKGVQVDMDCTQCKRYEVDLEAVETRPKTCSFINGNKFSSELIRCVLTLLDHNVGIAHVSPVIAAVLELVKMEADRLPTTSGVRNMGQLRLPLCHMEVNQSLGADPNITLYSDETSKFGQQYETYIVTTEAKSPKLLGIRELRDKSADTNLKTLSEVISDFDRLTPANQTPVGKTILSTIKNTMSDRAPTEKKFHTLLQTYRSSVLPQVIPNWTVMSDEERNHTSKMHNFFCGLHILVNMADMSADSLAAYEKKFADMSAEDLTPHDSLTRSTTSEHSRKRNAVVDVVRMACKAFARGGDEKNGCYDSVSIFLRARNHAVSLTRFKGNRFNILFLNSAVLYFLRKDFLDFLDNWHQPLNLLLSTLSFNLKDEVVVAGCRALGLVAKLITGPLWRHIERKDHVVGMNEIYTHLISSLSTCDVGAAVKGRVAMVPGFQLEKSDPVLQELVAPSSSDVLTEDILQTLFQDYHNLLSRLLQDQLPGGENWEQTPEECASSLRHNKLPESVFAQLDYQEHHKPSATTLTHESTIMYRFNKVGEWLETMTPESFRETLLQASTIRKIAITEFKARHQQMKRDKLVALQQKKEELMRRRENELKRRTQQTSDMVVHGLWQSSGQISKMLETYASEKEKIDAVKVQLRFRKNVLKQFHQDRTLFQFSKAGKAFRLSELVQHLTTLVNDTSTKATEEESDLVGKTVSHTFQDQHGVLTDYVGKVISQVPGFAEWFNIVYDCEPRTVYTYKLEEDRMDNCLRVID